MDIRTQQSTSGFIVGDLRMQQTKTGEPMLTVRVGQERFEAAEGGGFKQLDSHFFNIVQYGKAAERTFAQFKPGDRFVAEGYTRDFEFTGREGDQITGQEFVVKKIGHDTAWTRYVVDREPRTPSAERETPAVERQGPSREEPSAPDPEPSPSASEKSRSPRSKKAAEAESIDVDPGSIESPAPQAVGADIPF